MANNTNTRARQTFLGITATLLGTIANAQDPNHIRVDLNSFYDDNLVLQNSEQLDSTGTTLNADLRYSKQFYHFGSEINASGQNLQFSEQQDFNHTNTHIEVKNYIQTRDGHHSVHLEGIRQNYFQLPGSGFFQGDLNTLITTPQETIRTHYKASYRLGDDSSHKQWSASISVEEKDHRNHLNYTARHDYRIHRFSTRLSLQLSPSSQLFFQPELKETRYLNEIKHSPYASLKNDTGLFTVGLNFNNDYGFSGTAQAGLTHKLFADSRRGEFIGSHWDVNLKWSPYHNTTFKIESVREDREPIGLESYIDVRTIATAWQQNWGTSIQVIKKIGWHRSKFRMGSSDARDDLGGFGELQLKFNTLGRLAIETTLRFTENTSSNYEYEYQKTFAQITLAYQFL